jgi:hypothetical protein
MTPIIYALQNKLRFQTTSGNLSVEQLFELPITSTRGPSLATLATELATTITPVAALDFLNVTPVNSIDQIKFDVVKFIIQLKQEQNSLKAAEASKASQKKILQDLIATKKGEALASKSLAELEKELASL